MWKVINYLCTKLQNKYFVSIHVYRLTGHLQKKKLLSEDVARGEREYLMLKKISFHAVTYSTKFKFKDMRGILDMYRKYGHQDQVKVLCNPTFIDSNIILII